jgi:CheY-like chemotaxis protein
MNKMNEEEKINILIAEDNAINIQVAKYILSKVTPNLDFVMDGEDAVEHFRNKPYDLILMDVKMPVMDGLEATQKIRQIETGLDGNCHIPIIAMTASNSCEEAKLCCEAGMDDFLSKPFNIDDFRNILKSINLNGK